MVCSAYLELFERCLRLAERRPEDQDQLIKIAEQLLYLAEEAIATEAEFMSADTNLLPSQH